MSLFFCEWRLRLVINSDSFSIHIELYFYFLRQIYSVASSFQPKIVTLPPIYISRNKRLPNNLINKFVIHISVKIAEDEFEPILLQPSTELIVWRATLHSPDYSQAFL